MSERKIVCVRWNAQYVDSEMRKCQCGRELALSLKNVKYVDDNGVECICMECVEKALETEDSPTIAGGLVGGVLYKDFVKAASAAFAETKKEETPS